jgi:uncharacterized protein
MKLHLTRAEGQHLITGYADDYIAINQQRYANSLIVTPDTLITDWAAGRELTVDSLTEMDFEKIAGMRPEVVLLGTGKTHRFLHPKISALLTQQNISLECMTTAAACRTYNILMSEGRNVAAALIL